MVRDTIQLEDVVSTISLEYLREFALEYYIPEDLHPELLVPKDTIVDFPKGKVGVYTKFFEFANFCVPISQLLFDILGHFQIHLSQLSVLGTAKVSHFEINCHILNIIPTLNLFCVFYVRFYNSGWMSFSKQPGRTTPQCYTKPFDSVKNWNNQFFWVDERIFLTVVEWRSDAPKDKMPSADSYSAADVATLDTHHMDLFNLISAPNPTKVKTGTRPPAAHEVPLLTANANRVIDMEDTVAASRSSETPSIVEKSPLDFSSEDPPSMITGRGETEDQGLWLTQGAVKETKVRQKRTSSKKAVVAEDLDSEKSTSFTSMDGSPGSIYQLGWGVTNNCRLDTPDVWQDMVDHIFEQETKLLKKAKAQVAQWDQWIQAREKDIKNLEALLEAEAGMEEATEAKNAKLVKELESLHVQFSDLRVSNNQLSQQVSTLQAQVTGEERIKAAFEEFKKNEDDWVNSRCHRWVIGHSLRLAVMKCAESTELRQVFADVVSAGIAKGMSEGLKHEVEHEKAKLDLVAIKAYYPKADTKYVVALHALKDLKYPLVDQLEKLKDAPIDLIMASLYLESDFGEDAPQWIQDAFTANISCAEKKKKCRVVCLTHRVSFSHHPRSEGIPVSVPTTAPQGLAILLTDAATQTEIFEDEASPSCLDPSLYRPCIIWIGHSTVCGT
ncbi:hypothetical protein Tco_0002478 [Tanacetum coccineum]